MSLLLGVSSAAAKQLSDIDTCGYGAKLRSEGLLCKVPEGVDSMTNRKNFCCHIG